MNNTHDVDILKQLLIILIIPSAAVSIQLESENGLHVLKWFKKKGGRGVENITWYVKSIRNSNARDYK